LPASRKFQRVPATEAINRKAVERTCHQLLAGYSTAYGLVARISSFPVLNAAFKFVTLREGERFVKNVFRGGGAIAGDKSFAGLYWLEANFLSDHDLQIFDPSMANMAVSARPLGPSGLKVAKPEISASGRPST